MKGSYVLADRGYDADYIVDHIKENMKAKAVIPPRSMRIEQREYDATIYRERNKVERLFQRMKRFRGFATRYLRLPTNFLGLVYFVGIIQWVR
jgi:putative transposase